MRNGYIKVRIFQFRITIKHCAYKCQATTFSSERTVADSCKIAVFVKSVSLIYCNYSRVLDSSILYNTIKYQLTGFVHIGIIIHVNLFKQFCRRKHCTRIEEARKMIAAQMIYKRIIRNREYLLLQVLKIVYSHYLFSCLWVYYYKISKAEMRVYFTL